MAQSVPPMPPDYFQVLGVDRTAGLVETQRAFVLACFLEHPDRRGGTSKAGSRFLIVANAYATLIDTSLRTKFEQEFQSWPELAPTWTPYRGDDHPHPSWPTDLDMDDRGLLAAYTNILVDAYTLRAADSSRRLPMLVAVPTCLITLLSTARDVLIPILNELPAKQLLADLVDMAEQETELAARTEIKRRADEKMERRRRSRFRPTELNGNSIGLGQPPSPPHPPSSFPRRSSTPPPLVRTVSGVRDLVAILEERSRSSDEDRQREDETVRRRLSTQSTLSTSSRTKKKVTFDDTVIHGRLIDGSAETNSAGSSVRTEGTLPQATYDALHKLPTRRQRSASIDYLLERADNNVANGGAMSTSSSSWRSLEESTDPLYDSPQDEAYLSDISSSTSGTYASAVDLQALEDELDAKSSPKQKPADRRLGPAITPAPSDPRASWIKKSRPGAKSPPRLILMTNLDTPANTPATSQTASPARSSPQQEDAPNPPPSPTASTATTATRRRMMMNAIADRLPERVKKSFTPKTASSSSKSGKKTCPSQPSSSETLRPRRPRSSYPPITDDDFNAITRRPVSPINSRPGPTATTDLDYLNIVNSQLKPSRFLSDPHRVMDEIISMNGPPRPLNPPARRAPTVRSCQGSLMMHMSSGDESGRPMSTRSTSVLSFKTSTRKGKSSKRAGPTSASDRLNRVPSSSTISSFYANPPSPVVYTQSLHPTSSNQAFPRVRNKSSQSLDRHRTFSSRASTLSLPLEGTAPRRDSFFKRKRDQSVSDLEQQQSGSVITFKSSSGREKKLVRGTSPVFEHTASSGTSVNDSESAETYDHCSFSLPKLVHTNSLTDSREELGTPNSSSHHKPLPFLPPSLEPQPRISTAFGHLPKTIPNEAGGQRPISFILSSSTPDLLDRTSTPPCQFGFVRRASSSVTFIESVPDATSQSFPISGRNLPRLGHSRQMSSPAILPTYAPTSGRPSSILAPSRPGLRHSSSTTTYPGKRVFISPPMPIGSAPSVVVTPATPRNGQLEVPSSWAGSLRKQRHPRKHASESEHLNPPVREYVPVVDEKPSGVRRFVNIFSRTSKLAPGSPYDHPMAASEEWVSEKRVPY